MKKILPLLVTAVVLTLTAQAAKATVALNQNTTSPTYYDDDISNTNDLIYSGSSTLSGFSYSVEPAYSNPGAINDGAGGDNLSGTSEWLVNGSFPETFTFTLNTNAVTGSPLGYDISSIQSIAGWNNEADGSQNLTISYETVASSLLAPADRFITLGNYDDETTTANYETTPSSTQILLTNLGLTNVIALQFLYVTPTNANSTILHEADVFGTPTLPALVPEPGTYALFLAGAALLAARFRANKA